MTRTRSGRHIKKPALFQPTESVLEDDYGTDEARSEESNEEIEDGTDEDDSEEEFDEDSATSKILS